MIDNKKSCYESPKVQSLELDIENPILTGSDPTITNPDMGWED